MTVTEPQGLYYLLHMWKGQKAEVAFTAVQVNAWLLCFIAFYLSPISGGFMVTRTLFISLIRAVVLIFRWV